MNKFSLKKRSDLHLARKVWHASGVLFLLFCFLNLDRTTALQTMTFATAVFITVDVLRQQIPGLNAAVIHLLRPIMRESEEKGLAGTTYLLTGAFVIMALFPQNIVVLALLFLAIADPLASYFGILYGKDRIINGKTLQGTFAAFVCCTLISAAYYFSQNLMTERLLIVSILSGIVGSLAELIPLGKLDDNFTFPVTSALGLWGLFYLFGGI